jgi:hypothetical protein
LLSSITTMSDSQSPKSLAPSAVPPVNEELEELRRALEKKELEKASRREEKKRRREEEAAKKEEEKQRAEAVELERRKAEVEAEKARLEEVERLRALLAQDSESSEEESGEEVRAAGGGPEVTIVSTRGPGKSVEDAEHVRRAEEVAKLQGSGVKRGPDSGTTCQRCTSMRLECVKSGGPRQKACDGCVRAKQRCLAVGEEKPERKRARKEAEKGKEKERGPGMEFAEVVEELRKELVEIRKAITGVAFEVRRAGGQVTSAVEKVAVAAQWFADHYSDADEEVEDGEESEVGAELEELRAEVAEDEEDAYVE